MLFWYLRSRSIRFFELILPLLYFLALFFYFSNSPGNALFYLVATVTDSGPGGLFHLFHRLGGGAAVTGPFSDGATAPLLLGQLLFQLGRYNSAGPLLDRLAVLALALIFYSISAVALFYFSYNIASQKKRDTPERGVSPILQLI